LATLSDIALHFFQSAVEIEMGLGVISGIGDGELQAWHAPTSRKTLKALV
jgi:hypothetical protein